MSVYRFDKPVALVTRFWRKSQHRSRFSLARNFSAHGNNTHLFVALFHHWIEETAGLELTRHFLRQLLISAFPCAHDAWLSFALCHSPYEHVICLELRQGVCCRVHHNSTVWRTSSSTRIAEWAPISDWYVRRVVYHPCSVCGRFRSTQCSRCSRFTRNVKLSRLIRIGDCSPVTS